MRHCHVLGQLKLSRDKALVDDPNATKAVTRKLIEKVSQYHSVEKYMVFNPRTGQMASEAWLQQHIQVVNGKPEFKKAKSKSPKILTLGIKITNSSLDLTLDFGNAEPFAQPVRCMDLRSSQPSGDLESLTSGFGHMGQNELDSDCEGDEQPDFDEVDFQDDVEDENDYAEEDEIMDDVLGIQGLLA